MDRFLSFPFPFGCGSADVLWGGFTVLDFDLGVMDIADDVFAIFVESSSAFRAGVVIPADAVQAFSAAFLP